MIGFTSVNTDVSTLYFELFKRSNIEEGHLVGVQNEQNQMLLFQVINGRLTIEASIRENERVFTIGESEQLGNWQKARQGFETFNWVVPENSPVFHVTKELDVEIIKKDKLVDVGTIPNSSFPVNINIQDLVLYHSAILGVTGSGKSYLAYSLLEECAKRGIKVICLDITGDYKRYVRNPVLLNSKGAVEAFLNSNDYNIGIAEFADKSIHPIKAAHRISDIALNCTVSYKMGQMVI